MGNANVSNVTIRPEEADFFAKLARDWWNPKGPMASLHQVNPVRLAFIRQAIDAHWPEAQASPKPLAGKSALDIGCGAGLVCEPLARLGAAVTGVDAAAENVSAAAAHAEGVGLDIRYMAGEVGALDIGAFDLVTCVEVIEHVADKPAFLRDVAARLAPDGLLVMSTPNRTAASRVLLVGAAEAVGYVPKGTHHWEDFITPEEFEALLDDAGLVVTARQGIAWRPGKGLHLAEDMSLNYILSARRG
ncbi:MAG: bifunctional 2-polyprenyl-6-hydroxyphenol methylase/3-demethylubiquinol 3-O-methyltransferase UbiG [Erythrobacter sp.]|jgi:2-polyprenyl-6-hydroxyphenyl methylase/3-demethylubiquinone-9 3-methyltransferase|uniref:bifunctional 2-polyprenyl-6-hydroxyphenol methylase/3-demethylubiquinol 3-O-methyltransferase UbiG n=1 Tax=Erythrobacter sp. TaxID=1042 RepID=UPI002B48E372|nr:bifunctional 2-polyprenyl-6-hydroxyphenol methylase/3-demethylubiquinol 3-O-methyltransferase UbiG [Erythrobacter sp.]WRH69247.1 MAG: bifunctional 2-polyprenyl-6-hydroxyphenol methylase/3-demethylubiquinol 3-O-methyltransferase UbiG [Erythrobacter sp.]